MARDRFHGRGHVTLVTDDATHAPLSWRVTDPDGRELATVPVGDGDSFGAALDVLGLSRPGRLNPAVRIDPEAWDTADPWGSAMSAAWAVCEVARAVDVVRLPELGYRPAIGSDPTLDELADGDACTDDYLTGQLALMVREGIVSRRQLKLAMRVLNRYLDACKAAGLDY